MHHSVGTKHSPTLARKMGVFALAMTGITTMIGSGWLFGANRAAEVAGPAAIFAWIIGGIATILVALTFVEIGTMLPESGGTVRYLENSHGSIVGFMAAWGIWLSYVTVIPIEAEASVQYMSSWHWLQALIGPLFNTQTSGLTLAGLALCTVFVVLFFLINFWSVSFFSKSVTSITVFKILVPILTVILLATAGFHKGNFTAVGHSIMPYGLAGILTAVSVSGVIFAYCGFQTILNFAGEAKNPDYSIPRAVIYSIMLVIVIYVGLQVVFIGAVDPKLLASHGWHLSLVSPFAQLAAALSLNFLLVTLYIDAVVSPAGTGIARMGTSTRVLFAMSEHGHLPASWKKIHSKYRIPRQALVANLVASFFFLYLFRSWNQLAAVISATIAFSFLVGPVAVMSLRKVAPDLKRPIRVGLMEFIAPAAFVISSLVLYWCRWPLTGKVIFVLLAGFIIYAYYQNDRGWQGIAKHLKASLWLFCYLVVLAALSYLGSSRFGGHNDLPFGWDMLVVALVSLAFFYWGINSAWVTPNLQALGVQDNKQDNVQSGLLRSIERV